MRKSHSPYFVLLESSLGGRFTIAAWDPLKVIEVREEGEDVFEILREELRSQPLIEEPDLPFAGGWIGYFGYELYSHLEKKVPARMPDLLPKAVFCFYDKFRVYDHQKQESFLDPTPAVGKSSRDHLRAGFESNFARDDYVDAIRTIKNYITAGDCYQVNLSQRFSCPITEEPYAIYQRLRAVSPSPYAAYLNLGGAQILSSSPECFLEVNGRDVITRPIKGTRRRGLTSVEDAALREELAMSAKDRAELLMITDLERNDLGRVCTPGSIEVTEISRIESLPQVHHQVAAIRGKLADGKDVVDLLKATFPGGSITGAPKVRAMQIIRELEPNPRNVYCGSIGYISLNGKAQFNVAIRTMVLKNNQAYFWAGGGIVADSDPQSEYEETLTKAKGMMQALNTDHGDRFDLGRFEDLGEKDSRDHSNHEDGVIEPDRIKVG